MSAQLSSSDTRTPAALADAAKASQAANGGELTDFDGALLAAYTDMSADVTRIRKNRAERRRKMMEQQNKS